MRLLDQDTNKKLDRLVIYLTMAEVQELRDDLSRLLSDARAPGDHEHLSNQNFDKEITVCVYDTNRLDTFDSRSKELILHDK